MKNVAVWNIVLRPTVTQLIFSFSPFAQIIQFHENMMWNSNGNTFLSKSLSTSSARQHVFILIFQYLQTIG